jgi:CubicO group peptidase (beta-lactamase class C family)
MAAYAPAGGVVSSIGDMGRLAAALLDGSAPGGRALVGIEGVDTDRAQRRSGMFWVIDPLPTDGATMIWHNGQTGGYSAFIALLPQAARAVVVLANVANASEVERVALALAFPR